MHELAVMEGVVAAIVDRVGSQSVAVVRLEIGALAAIDAHALAFCFDICARDTSLAGARLDIVAVTATARCRSCDVVHVVESLGAPCACGSFDRELLTGTDIGILEVEVV